MFITTIRGCDEALETKAQNMAQELSCPYVAREKYSMAKLKAQMASEEALVVHQDKLVIETADAPLFFHPNMAQVRIKRLRSGGVDNMLEAMGIEPGMKVLDCTLGFGADAIVSAYGVGALGQVDAIEYNPFVAYVVREGLKTYQATNDDLQNAFKRINVIQGDYKEILKEMADNAYDIIYFDPMFNHPLMDSVNMNPLRSLANMLPLTIEALNEAKRVAKKRIVLKDNARSKQFQRLGFPLLKGGKYSPVAYGVLDLS